jgi:hypothetical protein
MVFVKPMESMGGLCENCKAMQEWDNFFHTGMRHLSALKKSS